MTRRRGTTVSLTISLVYMGCMVLGSSLTPIGAQQVARVQSEPMPAMAILERPVTVDLERVRVKAAVEMLAAKADVRIIYQAQVLDGISTPVTLRATGLPLGVALDRVLAGTGLVAGVLTKDVISIKKASTAAASVAQGGITGRVVDAKTRQGLRGATITLVGTNKGATSGDGGGFRLSDVAPGSYTVHIRMLGYVKATKVVTVPDGQTLAMDVAMEPSVNALDQVVVTGTVAATAQREVPNAMTVITSKQIEERGVTHIEQLFRGDIPGLFAQNAGSSNPLDQVRMYSRGATVLKEYGGTAVETKNVWTYNTADATYFTNTIKTYVDGVELADPSYLSQIDPRSIERIEFVTGPQASTIYGSNAINGVMQVFTKRGTAQPQLTMQLQSGVIQNNFSSALTPQHDYTAQVSGTEGQWSYQAGGSWNYIGAWTPAKQTSRTSGFGGARLTRGPLTADANIRLAATTNHQRGATTQQGTTFRVNGWYTLAGNNGYAVPTRQGLQGQTLGMTLGYRPLAWWSHELVVGRDDSDREARSQRYGYTSPTDTTLTWAATSTRRTSLRYATTARLSVSSRVNTLVTFGADTWEGLTMIQGAKTTSLTGTLTGVQAPVRQPTHNTGGFAQAQAGFYDKVFFTYGLRAEWNPAFGDDVQPNYAPRYGVAYTEELGPVTAKLRASFGRATRPPDPSQKLARSLADAVPGLVSLFQPGFGNYLFYLANPDLEPEHQEGWEGGVELYVGARGSLVVTRYNQVVEGLIASVNADSARSLLPNCPFGSSRCDDAGYGLTPQTRFLNVGNIRNQGWELRGTMNVGVVAMRGTYSWTKSRVIGIDPRYADLTRAGGQYEPGASLGYLPEHTWALGATYAAAGTTLSLDLNGVGMLKSVGNQQYQTQVSGLIRLFPNRARIDAASWNQLNAGYVMAAFNATHRMSDRVEGMLQMENLADTYHNDADASYASLGRQTRFGLRIRL